MKTFVIICCSLWCLSMQAQKIDPAYRLMAHRGGVTDGGKNPENSLAALDEAIRRGYTGAEIDVRQSKDGVLYLYHNRTFERDYHSTARADKLTWEEIRQLKPIKAGAAAPLSMEAYCKHAQGKLQDLMIDIKIPHPSLEFYQEVERILKETGFLNSSYFIGHGDYFRGKGPKITMLMREQEEFFNTYGEKTKEYYFLFAGVDEINGRILKWCRDNGVQVMACANLPFRGNPEADNLPNAGRTIKWLIDWGVTDYQIDSDYDIFFRRE